MSKEKLNSSRRNFLKITSLAGFGSLFAKSPLVTFLAEQLGIPPLKLLKVSYTCELFRQADLLHLKYFFFNAEQRGNSLRAFNTDYPLFIYVQVPPQHIAEELVKKEINSWKDFEKRNSFLASNSRLGFAMNAGVKKLRLDIDTLLNWNDNFHLITIDDFAGKKDDRTKGGYKFAIETISNEFDQPGNYVLSAHSNRISFPEHEWPLTKFELPYKMYLSPIAEPAEVRDGDFLRQIGEHVFKNENILGVEYEDESQQLTIVRPWENELVFRDLFDIDKPPRFKVVNWKEQQEADSDTCSVFLPSPVHRRELKGLTMRREFDRDVVSDLFRISSLGGTTNLKYKNDDPGMKYSIVAWQQKVKYSRDNYVSITYRAIDVFTGIKLLVSIISDRTFKFGTCYLPELYYVTYAEPEKNYQQPIVVSSVPFVKVIPKTKGSFFTPHCIPHTSFSYLVANANAIDGVQVNCEKVIEFDYIGIDKDGKEHAFKSKMIFIPAESYQITVGTYNYNPPGETAVVYAINEYVQIQHIGLLNPRLQTEFKESREDTEAVNRLLGCNPAPENYKFRLVKIFLDEKRSQEIVSDELKSIGTHVNLNLNCYTHKIESEITYGKLTALKADQIIRKDSANATFKTKEMLLLATDNLDVYQYSNRDNFLEDHPIRVVLQFAYVIVPQIDQMAGKSEFVKVKFYEKYLEGKRDIDENFDKNGVKLLFELVGSIDDFFSNNYRSAGAMVNPGIDITHISVLDQTIAYNDSHNETKAKHLKLAENKISGVQSGSIFGSMKAEILGMPLTQIMQEFLPIEDLPVFNYLQQAQESVQRITQIANEFKSIAGKWIAEYNEVKSSLESAVNDLKNLDDKIKHTLENGVRGWLEAMVEQANSVSYYEAARALNCCDLTPYKNILVAVNDKIISEFDLKDIKDKISSIINTKTKEQLISAVEVLFEEMYRAEIEAAKLNKKFEPKHVKELIKYYLINSADEKDKAKLEDVIFLKEEINSKYQLYFNAFNEGYKEATLYVQQYVINQFEKIEDQIKDQILNANTVITAAFGADFKEKLKRIILLHSLVKKYGNYAKIYSDLKQGHYENLAKELGIVIDMKPIADLEKLLIEELKKALDVSQYDQLDQIRQLYLTKLKEAKSWLRDFEELKSIFQGAVEKELKFYNNILENLNTAYEENIRELLKLKNTINLAEKKLQNFVQAKIEEAKAEIKKKLKELENEAKGSPAYKNIQAAVSEMQLLIRKIQEISKQKLEYKYSTKKFRSASLGGVIEFVPRNTELTVNVVYEIEFNISELDRLPTIAKQSFKTNSTLTDFKIGLLKMLFIDFERVQFISGSDKKDDFKVVIRDIQFAGSLSFVEAFQEFLTSISDNLVFDITSEGARIGYGFSIPDFSAGYFNFFNLSLSALLTLPFDPKKAMQIHFGIGNELNKFGLTVSGIFGGQGYFNIIAEPRRGIVGMIIVLEFGAIFNLNITVARGTAYLVGGIYIKRYDGNVEIRAYILCVGRLNIVAIFSASLSFYLGLHGDSNVLYGECVVTASKRFSRFFEISVQCKMEKQIKGAKSESKNPTDEANRFIEDTNYKAHFYGDEELDITLNLNNPDGIQALLTTPGRSAPKVVKLKISKNEGYDGFLGYVNIDLTKFKISGDYELSIHQNKEQLFSRSFKVSAGTSETCSSKVTKKQDVNSLDYYKSYYYEKK